MNYVGECVRLLGLHRFEDVYQLAAEGLAVDPDVDLVILQAQALIGLERYAEAEHLARYAIVNAPEEPEAHRMLGRALSRAGRYEEALIPLRDAVALAPHQPVQHVAMVECLVRFVGDTKGDARTAYMAEAREHARAAIDLAPADPMGYLVSAKAEIAAGQFDAAEALCRQGLAINPNEPIGHQIMGTIARERGDLAAAGDHYVEAGRINPRSRTTMPLLRSLRAPAPIGAAVVIVVAVVVAVAIGPSLGIAFTVGILLVAVAVVGALYAWTRAEHRTRLSEQTRRVLDDDRRTPRRPR